MQNIFIAGATGYMGTRLIKALQKEKSYNTNALVRKGSENKLPGGCTIVFGNALDASSYQKAIGVSSVFVHLAGVAHPSPSKKEQFEKIDLVSIEEAVKAATKAHVAHFIYLSVSMYPTKIMKDFQQVRAKGEEMPFMMYQKLKLSGRIYSRFQLFIPGLLNSASGSKTHSSPHTFIFLHQYLLQCQYVQTNRAFYPNAF